MLYQNPEKSRDFIFKNPGIGIQVQSRDPGIFRDPAGHCWWVRLPIEKKMKKVKKFKKITKMKKVKMKIKMKMKLMNMMKMVKIIKW